MHHDPNYMKKVPFCEAKQDLRMVVSTFFQKYYSKNQPKIQRCPRRQPFRSFTYQSAGFICGVPALDVLMEMSRMTPRKVRGLPSAMWRKSSTLRGRSAHLAPFGDIPYAEAIIPSKIQGGHSPWPPYLVFRFPIPEHLCIWHKNAI